MQASIKEIEETLRGDLDDPVALRAYGEWLSERGDARGTLIRLEQQLAVTSPTRRAPLEREIAEFVAEHDDWPDELPPGVQVSARQHGFATEVAVEWSENLREVIEQLPAGGLIRTLRITPGSEESDEDDDDYDDFDEDFQGGLRHPLNPEPLAGLDLGRFVELDLSYLGLGPEGAKAIATSLRTDRLREVDLRYCYIEDAGVAALTQSSHLSALRCLHLQRNKLTAEAVRSLYRLPELTDLDLRYNDIGEAGAQALTAAPFAGSLARLGLYGTDVGDGARTLAQAAELPAGLRSIWRSI